MGLRFPMFIDIENRKILLIGGGPVALRRIRTLLAFGADLTVVAKEAEPECRAKLEELQKTGKIRLVWRPFRRQDITREYLFVISAAGDPAADRQIRQICRELDIPVNIAADRTQSDFYFPAVVLWDDVVAGLAGDGSDHRKVAETAAWIRSIKREKEETAHEDHRGKQTEPACSQTGQNRDGRTAEKGPGYPAGAGNHEDDGRPDPS